MEPKTGDMMFSDKERNIIIMLVHEEKLKTIHNFDITENNIRGSYHGC